MPLVSPGIILVATVNSVGAVFQLIYVSIFISYAEKAIKVILLCLIGLVIGMMSNSVISHYHLWMPFPAEDIWIIDSSFFSISCHSLHEHGSFWLQWAAAFCWIFECCFSHFYVCFAIIHYCKLIWNSSIPTFKTTHFLTFIWLHVYFYAEVSHQDEERWIHALLSFSFKFLDESLLPSLWNVQGWPFHLCKYYLSCRTIIVNSRFSCNIDKQSRHDRL